MNEPLTPLQTWWMATMPEFFRWLAKEIAAGHKQGVLLHSANLKDGPDGIRDILNLYFGGGVIVERTDKPWRVLVSLGRW